MKLGITEPTFLAVLGVSNNTCYLTVFETQLDTEYAMLRKEGREKGPGER